MSIKKVLQHVDKNMSILVNDLRVLIRQPSVSAKNQGIKKCANLVKNTLKKSGIKAEILSMKDYPPVVYGEVKSKKNPNKTLLFYNHYDVQPVEPVELWDDDPFSGTIKGNKIYGRGSSDDKGELITRVRAIVSFLKVTGDVPCNVKFVIEGEEETGSAHIEEYLKKYRKKFSCDGILNGTTNYILTNMASGMSFNDALDDAKKKGYVEADESLDLDGLDAAAKLVILANWIMGMKVTMPDIKRTGIRNINSDDVKHAAEKNSAIKLIASCNKELTVAPKEIATVDPLCVSGTLNAISFTSQHSGTQTIIGRGAGGIETASSILRDLIDIRNESTKT